MTYEQFLNSKIKLAEKKGFEVDESLLHPILKPHQRDVVKWGLLGGCRAGFLSFGLGKTIIQLEILRQIRRHVSYGLHKLLVVCPLGVRQEFVNDGKKLGMSIKYITSTEQITDEQYFYITNYERVRMGSIDPSMFIAVTFDEASILRSLETETVDAIMKRFIRIPFRFVFTATPAPNRFLELINYAEYLGIMDRGQSLTRFFQRDSTTAGNLTLYERRKKEFWYWMSSWSCFVTKPSDLGYNNAGYDLPEINIHRHLVKFERDVKVDKKTNQTSFVADASKSLSDAAKEKRESLPHRVNKVREILLNKLPGEQWIIWCDQNAEQKAIESLLSDLGISHVSLTGSDDVEDREERIVEWKNKQVDVFLSKPEMYGQGVNMQQCSNMIFVGIDYQFEKFIQAIHRIYRFLQLFVCNVHVIYTDAEDDILKTLEVKWSNHLTLQNEMTAIIQEHGLNSDLFKAELGREMFTGRKEFKSENYVAVNNDCVEEIKSIADNSVHLICTSIPFGNHYEYSENYNCFGHNADNEQFFEQMDFLIPDLYRVLSPGRIAAIHVKDRIRYSYMNGTGFTSIDPFSDDTTRAFRKHGFHLLTRITVTTDVVQENNQTYRLGWSEKCKDGSKMGAGLPEYVLVFRKAPSSSDNAYADIPVEHNKKDYPRARWQLDAHAFWKSAGERLMNLDELRKLDLSTVLELWKAFETGNVYDYKKHIQICELLDSIGKLPSTFMTLPPQSKSPDVWDDITRMNTLNSDQSRRNLTKHICPLQLDIIERLIESYTNKGETVLDPFAGIMSVPYQALKMDRKAVGIELNTSYWFDGLRYLRSVDIEKAQLTLI